MADPYIAEDADGTELSLSWAGADEQLRVSVFGAPNDAGAVDFWLTPETAEQLANALLECVRVWDFDRG